MHHCEALDQPTSDAVTTQLAAMKPYAWTHIALGVEFGYHCSDAQRCPLTRRRPMTDTETQKFMIVLTDGMQTEPGLRPRHDAQRCAGRIQSETLCDQRQG